MQRVALSIGFVWCHFVGALAFSGDAPTPPTGVVAYAGSELKG